MRTGTVGGFLTYHHQNWELSPDVTVESMPMGTATRREVARARTAELMRMIRDTINNDPRINLTRAAKEAGMASSTLYRWVNEDAQPEKVDVTQITALADYLHDAYGHKNFAALWLEVQARIK